MEYLQRLVVSNEQTNMAVVLVKGKHIEAVSSNLAIPAEIEVIDLGRTE